MVFSSLNSRISTTPLLGQFPFSLCHKATATSIELQLIPPFFLFFFFFVLAAGTSSEPPAAFLFLFFSFFDFFGGWSVANWVRRQPPGEGTRGPRHDRRRTRARGRACTQHEK